MRRTTIVVAVVLAAALLVAVPAGADEPAAGTMDLSWSPCFAGPGMATPDWIGSITLEGDTYGMAFFNLGNGKAFDHPTGSAMFFTEVYALYPEPIEDCPGTAVDLANALLWGYDSGMLSLPNSKYHMSGWVEEASGPLAGLAGGSVYMSGIIVWDESGNPAFAPGQLRITRPDLGASPEHQAL